MKLLINVWVGVFVTIAGASAFSMDLGKSLTDIPTDKRASALLKDFDR